MAKATTKSATKATKTSAAAKTVQTAQERFAQSMKKVKSTGDAKADKIATAVVTKIFNNDLVMKQVKNDFVGKIGKTEVKIFKESVGKSSRYVISVGGVEIRGAYAAKAFTYANTRANPKAAKTVAYDQSQLDSVLSILG